MDTSILSAEILASSRIPRKFWDAKLKTFFGDRSASKAIAAYLNAADLPDVGLFLRGKSCGGKTYLAVYVLLMLLYREHSVLYLTLDDLTDMYFGKLDDSKDSFSARILARTFLCIDNINCPTGNGNRIALLRAIRLRSDNALPYMICSRLDNDELLSMYGTVAEDASADTRQEGDLLSFFQRDLLEISVPAVPIAVAQHAEKRKAKYAARH